MESFIIEIRNNVRLILQKLNNLPSSSNSDGVTVERLQYVIIDLQKQLEEKQKELDKLYGVMDRMADAYESVRDRVKSIDEKIK